MQNTTQMLNKSVSEIETAPKLLSMDDASRKRWDSAIKVLRKEIYLHQTAAFKTQVFELARTMLGNTITTEEIHMIISDGSRPNVTTADENPKRNKPVCQYDLQGKFIAEYPSISDAISANVGAHKSGIYHACEGRQYSCNGYIWKYKSDGNHISPRVINLSRTPVKIGQYDANGNLVKTHDSISAAARTIGAPRSTLRRIIDRNCNFTGFIWKTITK